ncbi:MAG: hypothetical protein JWM76_123, partial [Pseudonocardiales bacterium]|nr:hypothetical protein [Pseudonocardiales bacterium]
RLVVERHHGFGLVIDVTILTIGVLVVARSLRMWSTERNANK